MTQSSALLDTVIMIFTEKLGRRYTISSTVNIVGTTISKTLRSQYRNFKDSTKGDQRERTEVKALALHEAHSGLNPSTI